MNKKLLSILLSVGLVISLCACGKDSNATETTNAQAGEVSAVTKNDPVVTAFREFVNNERPACFGEGEEPELIEKYAESWYAQSTAYTITDLNGDQTPELIINCWGSTFYIFYYDQDVIKMVYTPFYSGATGETLLENGMIMLKDDMHANRVDYEVYQYTANHELESVENFAYSFYDDQDMYYIFNYENDDVIEISKEEYEEKVKFYEDKKINVTWEPVDVSIGQKNDN